MNMNKEQQIEEMAKLTGGCPTPDRLCEKCWCGELNECSAYIHAKSLYNAGYRKKSGLLIEFTEKLKEKYGNSCSEDYPLLIECTSEELDKVIEELL